MDDQECIPESYCERKASDRGGMCVNQLMDDEMVIDKMIE